MQRLSRWIGARPYRAPIVNICLFCFVLLLAGSNTLYILAGTAFLALASLVLVGRALRRSVIDSDGGTHLYQHALIWIPGLLAVALAGLALRLITTHPVGDLAHSVGLILFTFELVMPVLALSDLGQPSRPRRSIAGGV